MIRRPLGVNFAIHPLAKYLSGILLLALVLGLSAMRTRAASSEKDLPATCYLFSYFIGNGEDGLHLAWSRDGYHWDALNGGKSYLHPEVGESKLMRDPCLLLGPDGIFRMVWTTAWEGKTIGYASSRDLLTWTPQQAVPVMAQEPETMNCWAPEIDYDAKKKAYLIFWASTVPGKFTETAGTADKKYNHRIYSTTTKDFSTYSPTQLFYEPGFCVIDATILPADGRFYLIVKDETLKPVKKHLRIASSDSIDGPYTDLAPSFTRNWVEGPTALKVGDDYLVYFDVYREKHYGAMRSRDLKTWEDVTSSIALPKGIRHGTALAVPSAVVARLLAASVDLPALVPATEPPK